MSKTSVAKGLCDWFWDRAGLELFHKLAEEKVVPVTGQSFWYYMGGIVLFLIGAQVVTGALLLVYYTPSTSDAHSSILRLSSDVNFGWFVRSLHSWGVNLLIGFLVFHFFSTYFMKAYRKPRELTWLTGLILGALMLGFGFTGYLLPWNEVALFATKVGIHMTELVPFVGQYISLLLQGGPNVGPDTLTRFFDIHVIVLPLLLLPILGIHLYLITLHGNAAPKYYLNLPPNERSQEKFFPSFMLKDFMGWILVFNLLVLVVGLFPQSAGQAANPFAPAPIGIKPEWYFLAVYQFLKLIPSHIGPFAGEKVGLLLITLALGLLVIIPFIDTGRSRWVSWLSTGYGVLLAVCFIFLSVWGYLS